MLKIGLAAAAGIMASLFAGQAQAVPSCTGTTQTVGSFGTVLASFLVNPSTGVSTGNCVQAGDKLFGSFSDTGLANTGAAQFIFDSIPANVTISFLGGLGPNS